MYQRKSVLISCLLCLCAIITVMVVIIIAGKEKVPVSEPAVSCDQLSVTVSFSGKQRAINVWRNSEDVLYFFLPAGANEQNIVFGNLGAESILQLESVVYTSEHPRIEEIEFAKNYTMFFYPAAEEEQIETAQVVFLKSDNIPSLFIDTESGSLEDVHSDKEVKEAASMQLVRSDGSIEYLGELEYIKSRGNTSFFMNKKSYQIKLPKDYRLLDMPSAKKWILLADMVDDTLIKNEIVYRFTEEYTNIPSIQGKFVDLYLNGDYVGNYYLCEKIEIDENRLNITDLEELTEQINYQSDYDNASLYVSEDGKVKAVEGLENPQDITGGYLVEYAGRRFESDNAFMTDYGIVYDIVSPNPATAEQAEYIRNRFNEFETALHQTDGIHPDTGKHFSEYINVDSWISKYLVEEMFHDPDAAGASIYFYKDADSKDSLIYAGPVWDYDRALGSYGIKRFYLDDPMQVGGYGLYYKEMMQHQEVREKVYEEFRQHYLPYAEFQASADIYQLSKELWTAIEMNRVRWPQVSGYYSDTQASVEYLIDFLRNKADYLEETWLEDTTYCTVTFLDYYGSVYTRYTVKKGGYLDSVPGIASYIALFNGWYSDDGVLLDLRLPVLQDVTYRPTWIDMDLLLQNGLNMAELDISQVDPDVLRQLADMVEEQQSEVEAE